MTLEVVNLRWMGCRMIKGAEKKALVELPQQERFRGGWDERGSGNQTVKRNFSEKQLLDSECEGLGEGHSQVTLAIHRRQDFSPS